MFDMPRLLIVMSAPAQKLPDGRLRLDVKFLEGLPQHADSWDGPVECLLWEGATAIPFGRDCDPAQLTVPITVLPAGMRLQSAHLSGADAILASADLFLTHDLPAIVDARIPIVYTIEYTLKTRLDILRLGKASPVRKLRSALWLLNTERRMRRAFRAAAAIQCNGFPAHDAYRGMTRDAMLFLDGRMTDRMFATAADQAARKTRLQDGHPLRLVNFGRLERMKGAQDLLPFARKLKELNFPFKLDIFGTGELEAEIRDSITRNSLADCVTLHPPAEFATELVPWLRENADIFLSCHRQDDPSCAYIEAMGCGLPVLGYDNAMWSGLLLASRAGWSVPLGDVGRLAGRLTELGRDDIAMASDAALDYAKAHDFETEFAARMTHLREVFARR